MFGEFAFRHFDLAAPANAAPAADRIEIDAELARGLQQAEAVREALPFARWREDDEMFAQRITRVGG